MATVTGFTAERMQNIEDATVVDGNIVGDDLILITNDATEINAGSVRGPQGIQGPIGEVSDAELTAAIAAAHATGAIDGDQLASNAVTTSKILNGAVTNAKLGADAVNGSKIADSSIGSEHIVSGAVTNAKLGAGSVNDSKTGDPSSGSLDSGRVQYARFGKLVIVWTQGATFGASSVTLPSGFRPGDTVYGAKYDDSTGDIGILSIGANGLIPAIATHEFTAAFLAVF